MSGVRLAEMLFERHVVWRHMAVKAAARQTCRNESVTMSIDSRKAAKVAKEQRRALIAAASCHMRAGAWHASGLSSKAIMIMPAVKVLHTACKSSRKCGWSPM